ncbi:hypothetical protein AVW11_28070 [Streptomyces amritsarensis]|uniref:CsbD family protein n=1 Tax=Streptomyces amritsarensis TaxID=681158 RepID=A0ABX3FW37_9ACTN|nr:MULTISPECIES: hypothetical protein [Streptomyces]OLZ58549.1 hypothetical protein AVW11_28070 [Streptomyces amritsarensis]
MGMKDKGRRLKEAAEEVMGTGKKESAGQHGREVRAKESEERRGQQGRGASFEDAGEGTDER